MLKRSQNARIVVLSLITSVAVMLASTHAFRVGSNPLQAIAFVALYLMAVRLERTLALLSVLTFIILCIFTREPIQSTESIRGVLFALTLVLFSNENRKITPALGLYACWFIYFSFQLMPINIFDELIAGTFPLATSKTIELMLYELMGISFIELFFNKKTNNRSDTLFGYQSNFIILATSIITLIFFAFAKISIIANQSTELKSLQNPSSAILLLLFVGLFVIIYLSAKFSKTFENIFAHLELCATPDSSFLTLSRNPALALVEYQNYSKSIRKKSEALTASRKKNSELKVELSAIKRQIQDLNEKWKDLAIMADSINIGMLALTMDGTITYVNKRFYEILNLEMSHAEMLHYENLITSDSVKSELLLDSVNEALKTKRSATFSAGNLIIDIQTWSHLEPLSKKEQNALGAGRIMVFLKELESVNKSQDLDLPA